METSSFWFHFELKKTLHCWLTVSDLNFTDGSQIVTLITFKYIVGSSTSQMLTKFGFEFHKLSPWCVVGYHVVLTPPRSRVRSSMETSSFWFHFELNLALLAYTVSDLNFTDGSVLTNCNMNAPIFLAAASCQPFCLLLAACRQHTRHQVPHHHRHVTTARASPLPTLLLPAASGHPILWPCPPCAL